MDEQDISTVAPHTRHVVNEVDLLKEIERTFALAGLYRLDDAKKMSFGLMAGLSEHLLLESRPGLGQLRRWWIMASHVTDMLDRYTSTVRLAVRLRRRSRLARLLHVPRIFWSAWRLSSGHMYGERLRHAAACVRVLMS